MRARSHRAATDRREAAAALGLAVAYPAFAATFRGPRDRFWQRMTATGAALGTLALLADPDVRSARPRWRDLAVGASTAAALYGVFTLGDRLARIVMPTGVEDITDVYELRRLRPKPEIALRLAAVIGPAEELFWRGLLAGALQRRLGRWRGAAAAGGAYAGAHLVTGNLTLVGAAGVAGAFWGAGQAVGVSMPALVVSHVLWDVGIFLVAPTAPLPD